MGDAMWRLVFSFYFRVDIGMGSRAGLYGVGFGVKLPSSSITEPRHEILPEPAWVTQAQVFCQALTAIQARLLAVSGHGDTDMPDEDTDMSDEDTDMSDEDTDMSDEDTDMSDEGTDVADEESGSEDNEAAEVDRILKHGKWRSLISPAFAAPPLIFGGIDFNTTPTPHIDLVIGYSNIFSGVIPNCLTYAQKEWLLETEWAQRAFLASYTLAVMDNVTTFKNVRTFTVTKLSARYLDTLHRPGFWAALPNLATVTLIVSPDWRDIVKKHEGYFADHPMAPSDASGSLYRLVQDCIAPLEKIKTLTLGFIGGGEHATGLYARNQHVLPGPILADPLYHMAVTNPLETLQLPFVEHLTFTNCWFGPYALRYFVNEMRQASLHTLRLDSVSLIGIWSPSPAQLVPNEIPGWRTTDPRPFSWPGIVNAITPGPSLAAQRVFHNTNRRIPSPANNGALKRLEFVSCGYVRLMLRSVRGLVDDLGVEPWWPHNHQLARRKRWLGSLMMVPGREEKWLARILSYMRYDDRDALTEAFGLSMGWEEGKAATSLPKEDDQEYGGVGRFRGVLVAEAGEGNGGEGVE